MLEADQRGSDGGLGLSVGTNGISVYEHGDSYMPPVAVYVGSLATGVWHDIMITCTDRVSRIYLNGALVHTGLQSSKQTVYAPFRLGNTNLYGGFVGLVSHVALYDYVLTPAALGKATV